MSQQSLVVAVTEAFSIDFLLTVVDFALAPFRSGPAGPGLPVLNTRR